MLSYDIHFAVSGIVLSVLVLVFISVYYPKGASVRAFQKVLFFNVIGSVSDAVTGYYDAFPNVLPLWSKYVLNSLCLLMGAWTTYAILQYMIVYIKEKENCDVEVSIPFLAVMSRYAFTALYIVNFFVPILFYFDEQGYYVHGKYYALVFTIPVIYVIYSGLFAVEKRRLLLPKQIIAIIVYIAFSITGMLFQVLFFPNMLLIYYFAALALLCMTFTLETPNFIKLNKTMAELEEAKSVAESATKAKDTFLANISHEIRTPLNAILGMDSMIIRETRESKTYKHAKNIKSAGNTLLSIINDILDFSKVESGMMDLVCTDYRTASVFNDVRNMTLMKAESKGLEYSVKIAEHFPAKLHGDEVRIRQIMLNLVNNAVKYTDEGAVELDVNWENRDNNRIALIITVKDTGIGIKEEDMDSLFVSFKRLDEAKHRKVEGTGLGLPLTKQLAEMMDGTIEVESKYGQGSVFKVTILQDKVGEEEIENMNDIFERAISSVADYEAKMWAPDAEILVVDDNEMNLEVFVELLGITDIKIDAVCTGEECIALCRKKKYDVIFLDQMMSGMDGIETLGIIKEKKLAENTPIIMFTADAIAGARERYMGMGFNDFMTKPVEYERIEEILYKYLPSDKIRSIEESEQTRDYETVAGDRTKLLVIDGTKENLDNHKSRLGGYDATFVLDNARAQKYMTKHDVEYVLISKDEYLKGLEKEHTES